MGFLYFSIKILKCLSFPSLQNLVSYLKSMFMVVLIYLGLLKLSEHDRAVENPPVHYVLVMNGISPSLVPIPIHILTAQIKKTLPVVSYSDFLDRFGVHEDDDICPVCLECIEKSHEIRELCNCSHVFHRGCLDRWLDEDQVTCPSCRSVLYPDPVKERLQVVEEIHGSG